MNGEKLKEIRESNNISRKELAKKIYVTEAIIQSWEQGWYIEGPSSGEVEEMAEIFNMSEEVLRNVTNMPEEDDSDNNTTSFIDYIDAGVRAIKYIKDKK